MAKAPLTPQQLRQQGNKSLSRNIEYGFGKGGIEGAMMGFMGLPYMARPGATHGNIGGPWQQMWPGGVDPNMRGNGGNPGTGGDGPAVDPNDPNDPNNPANAGKFAWTFPQYSQTWAFTPPEPTPYPYPQKFDPAVYGNPLAKKY